MIRFRFAISKLRHVAPPADGFCRFCVAFALAGQFSLCSFVSRILLLRLAFDALSTPHRLKHVEPRELHSIKAGSSASQNGDDESDMPTFLELETL
jgi:hypothetical protein